MADVSMNHKPLKPSVTFAVVVNDDPTQLTVLSGLVRKAGLEPRVFTSAEAALMDMAAYARAVGIVTRCPRRMMSTTPQNPSVPTAKPKRKNKIRLNMPLSTRSLSWSFRPLTLVKNLSALPLNSGLKPSSPPQWTDGILLIRYTKYCRGGRQETPCEC